MKSQSSPLTRRRFMQQLASVGVVSLQGGRLLSATSAARIKGANDRVRIGILGCQRGDLLARHFAEVGAEIACICDPDEKRLAKTHKKFPDAHAVADLRRVLDDQSIDAVAVATPDHWHAPAAMLACQAGKHIYLEKPCSHNILEGRWIIDTVHRFNRICQVGTQCRSSRFIQNAIQRIREGAIGDVLTASAWNSQQRRNIGHVEPSTPPAGFDYDLWVGPAAWQPYRKNCHHYTWHWWYNFGTGDAGNDGVHELDIALWALGVTTHPNRIAGYGRKLFFDDDQQFPDTQNIVFSFPADAKGRERIITYEQRIWSPYFQGGCENGVTIYGTEGYLTLSKIDGWRLYGPKNELLQQEQGSYEISPHAKRFLDALRGDAHVNADVEISHRSTSLVHLANILSRCSRGELEFDPNKERFVDCSEANELLGRAYRDKHWAKPSKA